MKAVIQTQFIDLIHFNYNTVQNYTLFYYSIMTFSICQKHKKWTKVRSEKSYCRSSQFSYKIWLQNIVLLVNCIKAVLKLIVLKQIVFGNF